MAPDHRTVKLEYLSRVEGEGGLFLRFEDDEVVEAKLNIFEPPRFFEAFLRGRHFQEVPDITARICGICPVAYQMSSVHAIEKAFGVIVDPRHSHVTASAVLGRMDREPCFAYLPAACPRLPWL